MMGTEIERKFLVLNDSWRGLAEGVHYRQGYLNPAAGPTVRVRTIRKQGFLTIKGPTVNAARLEYEYAIPFQDACEMLARLTVSPIVEKRRYTIPYEGFTWEVDEFLGASEGLIFAEIELEHRDQTFPLPSWIGREVTDDPRYYNSNIARNPYSQWKDAL